MKIFLAKKTCIFCCLGQFSQVFGQFKSSIVIEVIGTVLFFFMKDILDVKNTNKNI